MHDVFLYDAVRSPRTKGRPGGALSPILPHQLVAQIIDALRDRIGPPPIDAIERFVLSCVGQVGPQGGNLALVSKLEAGLPATTATQTINNFCVGGMTALGTAASFVRSGDTELALAGGVEMMSHVPFLHDEASYYADAEVAAHLEYAPVGVAADLLATRHGVERDELDAIALESHRRAAEAWSAGRYASHVVAIDVDGHSVSADETIRPYMTAEDLRTLPAVFDEMGRDRYDDVLRAAIPGLDVINHRHTLAHCPPIADGAGMLVVGNEAAGERFGLEPLARVVGVAEAGGDHVEQLTAGEMAMTSLLARHGLSVGDLDVVEYMEAFAVVPALFLRTHDVDPARVNPNGGHLAMGHPMGATGAILVAAVAHELAARRSGGGGSVGRGLAVAHGGSGVGAAVLLESV